MLTAGYLIEEVRWNDGLCLHLYRLYIFILTHCCSNQTKTISWLLPHMAAEKAATENGTT
jgi:hypothetical protein